MGAALLREPDKLISILESLVKGCQVPVSCKIRILEDLQETTTLMDRIFKTGIIALAIHARFREDRPIVPARWSIFRDIFNYSSKHGSTEGISDRPMPIYINGDFFKWSDILAFRREYPEAEDFLIARGAQANPAIFLRQYNRTDGFIVAAIHARLLEKISREAGPHLLESFLSESLSYLEEVAPVNQEPTSNLTSTLSTSNMRSDSLCHTVKELLPVAKLYLSLCFYTGSSFSKTKYTLIHMWSTSSLNLNTCPIGTLLQHAKCDSDLAVALGMSSTVS